MCVSVVPIFGSENAGRSDGFCSTLHRPMQAAAKGFAALCVSRRSTLCFLSFWPSFVVCPVDGCLRMVLVI